MTMVLDEPATRWWLTSMRSMSIGEYGVDRIADWLDASPRTIRDMVDAFPMLMAKAIGYGLLPPGFEDAQWDLLDYIVQVNIVCRRNWLRGASW